MFGYAPTSKPWISMIMQTLEIEFSPMRLSIVGGILRKRFEDRYGYEPDIYSVFIEQIEVVLYKCFDHDLDIVLEAISGSDIDRKGLIKLRSSTREAAAAA